MKYYELYEERYRSIYAQGTDHYFSLRPISEVVEFAEDLDASLGPVADLGCGEGRDARYLARLGCYVDAYDQSTTGLERARALTRGSLLERIRYLQRDLLALGTGTRYPYVIAVGVLHMLVTDADRSTFLRRFASSLAVGGRGLLVNMGHGDSPHSTPIADALTPVARKGFRSDDADSPTLDIAIPAVTCRQVTWREHYRELELAGLSVLRALNTENHEYGRCMTVWVSTRSEEAART